MLAPIARARPPRHADRLRAESGASCRSVRRGLPAHGLLAAMVLVLSWLAPRVVRADDPTLDWWTIETTHFRVHYERGLEAVAERIATLGETIHERLVGPLGYTPDAPTEVVLTDDTDSANGSALSVPFNTIRLYVTAPDDLSALNDHDDWYLALLVHEYTHILHVDDVSGVPTVVNTLLGKLLTPNQLQPRWILEGLATVVETAFTSGGRVRSSLFDMYLRADVLDNHVAGLDQISSHPRRWPQGTLYYLYGSRFLDWIREVYGPDTLRAVAVDYGAALAPFGINRAIRRVTGMTYPELYEGFRDALERRYAALLAPVYARGLVEGKRLTFDGYHASYPVFVPRSQRHSAHELLYFRDDGHDTAGQYRLAVDEHLTPTSTPELVVRTAQESPVTFLPDGSLVFAALPVWQNLYRRPDLVRLPPGESAPHGGESTRQQLTSGLRATAPAASPDGRRLAYTVNSKGTTTLEVASMTGDHTLVERRIAVTPRTYDQAYTPAFSPDGRLLAYSAWTHGGYRDIRIVDLAAGEYHDIFHDRALDTGPCFSSDGATLYFSSDRTGIYNIYAYDLATGALRQVTNVRTGAFMPAVSDDGQLLVYVGYGSEGYDLFALPLRPESFLEPLPAAPDRPRPPAEPVSVALEHHRYDPLPTLRPRSYFFNVAPGAFGSTAVSITSSASDVVGQHSIAMALTVEPNAPGPAATLDYAYHRLPVDLGLHLGYRYAARTDYRIADHNPRYIERGLNVRPSVSYGASREFASQRITFAYNANIIDSDLPVASVPLDPYASRTVLPPQGFLGVVNLDYSVSSVESSTETAGPASGFYLALGVDYASEITGASETLHAFTWNGVGYVTLPWPGYHTLAVRSAGGFTGGTYARRGLFSVGGYNLEANGPFEQLTKGALNGSFALRGYPAGAYAGAMYVLQNLEYRMPLVEVDHGISTLPLYLRRLSGNLFLDFGGAFNRIDFDELKLFEKGAIIRSPVLHTAVGAELWLETTLAYALDVQFRLGYAYGFSAEALPNGQVYFVASNAF